MLHIATLASMLAVIFTLTAATPTPTLVARQAASGTTAVVTATPSSGNYFGPVTVGGVTYKLLFDTGSSALWIKGNGTGTRFNINYGQGAVTGTITSGAVTVGGITIANQPYGLADGWDPSYNSYDGIIGLGPSVTQYNAQTSSWTAKIRPLLQSQVLGVNLISGGNSVFSFGTTSTAGQTGPTYWAPSTSTNSWLVSVSSFGVTPSSNDTSATCFVDTGNTDTYTPLPVFNAYWHNVTGATVRNAPGRYEYQFPCTSTVWDFKPTINGNTLAVAGKYETFNLSPNPCISRLQGTTGVCNLGQPLLYSYYTVFDYQNTRIGFTLKT